MKYQLIIFDFDGTLADSYAWFVGALERAAQQFHFRMPAPEELEQIRHCHAREIMARMRIPLWKVPAIGRFLRREMSQTAGKIALFPGAEAMLLQLSGQGLKLAMVSSNTEENIRQVLGERLAGCLAFYGCGATIFGKRAKLRKAGRHCRCQPAEVLCIGDELRDHDAARAEGMAFGAVAWGYTHPEALARRAPAEMFYRMEDICGRLG